MVESMSMLTSKASKLAFDQAKRIHELELRLSEKAKITPQQAPTVEKSSFKAEVDRLLKANEFDAAFKMMLKADNSGFMFKLLECINPKPLFSSRSMEGGTVNDIFEYLLECFKNGQTFDEIMEWFEALAQNAPMEQSRTCLLYTSPSPRDS